MSLAQADASMCDIVAQQATSAIDPESYITAFWLHEASHCLNLHSQANMAQKHCWNCRLLLESSQIGCSQVYGSK